MRQKTWKLEKIDNIVKQICEEEVKVELERRTRLEEIRKEKEKRKKEKLKKENNKRRRLEQAEMLGKRWEMLRWLTEFLKENEEKWEKEKKAREEENRKKLDEWERLKRLEKIKILKRKWSKEKLEEKENLPNQKETWETWRAENEKEKSPNKLGLSWAKLRCQLGFGCTVINIFCLILINMK